MRPDWITPEIIDQYIKEGYWEKNENLLDRNARDFPDKEALVDARTRLTFSQLQTRVDRLAIGFLEMGLVKDQMMLCQLPNITENIIVHAAMAKAGIISISGRMDMRHNDLEYALEHTEAIAAVIVAEYRGFNYVQMIKEISFNLPHFKYIFVAGGRVPKGTISISEMMENPIEKNHPSDYLEKTAIKTGDLASIATTSGTTGKYKLGEAIYGTRWSKSTTAVERWDVTENDIFAAISPIGSGGPCYLAAPLKACKVALFDMAGKFDPAEALDFIIRENVTFACGVPAQLTMISKYPDIDKYKNNPLRAFYYVGATIPYSTSEAIEEKLGCRIVTVLGGKDIGLPTISEIDAPAEVRRRSVGKPYYGVEVKLIDEYGNTVPQGEIGEIVVGGPTNVHSYYKDPEATKALIFDGNSNWTRMGDLGRFDEEGFLYVVGRQKDMIIRGGENIYPAEIENILMTHPKIFNVAIVGMPDPIMGEKVCAYIIPKTGQTIILEDVQPFLLQKRIDKYKLPERIELVDNFPMAGDDQKVLKRELVARLVTKLKTEGVIEQ